jgi:hypothetical protein
VGGKLGPETSTKELRDKRIKKGAYMNIETVLLIVIVTFACGFVLDRWNVRLSRYRRRQAVRPSRAV